MLHDNLNDLIAFMVVAQERSFTRAAAKMGVSPSALSHTMRNLEERMKLRLLTRTTRSVSATEAGEYVLENIQPLIEEMQNRLAVLSEFKNVPSGTIRINAAEHAVNTILLPKLTKFLPQYPDIRVEVAINYGLIDIVEQKFDAGVRLGENLDNDMIAVRIGPDMRMAVVATPAYFQQYAQPEIPQDLARHNCINLRLPRYDNLYAWEFEKEGRQLKVQVQGQLIFNQTSQRLDAALAGAGIAYVPEDLVLGHIKHGRLVRVLEDWCEPFTGYHLYYPNRRQPSKAFSLLLDALRYAPGKEG
ncbi:LysR family transcriptional regulator [Saezia sanguinis]|uniref:LysR family transcriptional regulator n=1 Tax=Saezia sanguinis TaxID=1965230 RepID=UPI0030263BAC